MATKIEYLNNVYQKKCHDLATPAEWQAFLSSACTNYKCRFDEQVLIFEQFPEATAVLEIEKWNKYFGRWVNKGATGIAVFNSANPERRQLKYYFDVSDTHESSHSRPVPIWQMEADYEDAAISNLENLFGELKNKSDLPMSILSAAENAADDHLADYFTDLMNCRTNSFLEDVGEEYVAKAFKELVTLSISAMLLTRCGYDVDEYIEDSDFRAIHEFNTTETITAVGLATSDIAEMALREISSTVLTLQKSEKTAISTFAPKPKPHYNSPTIKTISERTNQYDTDDLHSHGRLQPTERHPPRGGSNPPRQIRTSAQDVSGEPSSGAIRESADILHTERSSDGNREHSEHPDGATHQADGGTAGRDGTTQSEQPDGMGGQNEQHSPHSRGNRSARPNLQLTTLPTIAEQQNNIEQAAVEKTAAFVFSQEEIDQVLQRGSGIVSGKYRIYEYFTAEKSRQENVEFLKKEYGTGGSAPAVRSLNINESHDAKGLTLCKYASSQPPTEITLSWNKVASRLLELITTDRYLNAQEKANLPAYREKLLKETERNTFTSAFMTLVRTYNDYQDACQEPTKKLNAHSLSTYAGYFSDARPTLRNADGLPQDILPLMQQALHTIIAEDIHFTTTAKELLKQLSGDIAIPFQPLSVRLTELHRAHNKGFFENTQATETVMLQAINHFENLLTSNEGALLIDTQLNNWRSTSDDEPLRAKLVKYSIELNLLADSLVKLEYEYQYHLGDLVFLGADEYEIVSVDEKEVVLYNTTFPLLTEHIPTNEFTERLAQTEANNHFKVVATPKPRAERAKEVAGELLEEVVVTTTEETLPPENERRSTDELPLEVLDTTPPEPVIQPDLKVGQKLTIEKRDYVVAELKSNGEVALDDITFQQHAGFPIQRVEKVSYIQDLLRKQPVAQKLPPPLAPKKPPTQGQLLHPDIPQSERNQFKITDNDLGHGKPREKFHANIAAIQTLQQCALENRLATPEEQAVLSGYIGWGGLADAFDAHNTSWQTEYAELKSLLTDSEYDNARASTLTAFYTPPTVIGAMYQVLENMGFKQGNILEPSCGVGNFMGTLPESMASSKLYGIELDSISGRIAQQLYQQSNIAVQGYENTTLPDSFFDVAIGNVPFGQFKVSDKKYDKHNFLIHDYFFGKTLDKVRAGGVVAFITSKGTMDKENATVRTYLAQRAEFLGAIRLPNNTFKANAGTEVTSDIIFLQKRDRPIHNVDFARAEPIDGDYHEANWVHLNRDDNGIKMNQYFIDHPDMILGEMREVSGPYGPETACVAFENQNLQELLAGAVINIHADFQSVEHGELEDESDIPLPADPNVRNFSYTLQDDRIYFRENSIMTPVTISDTGKNRIKGLVQIRDCVRNLIDLQTNYGTDDEIMQAQKTLNTLYDRFSKRYGLINSRGNNTAFSADSSYSLLCSLELVNENGALERKADMFTKRTIKPHTAVTSVDTSSEALAVSISEKASVDMEYMEQLTGKSSEVIATELEGIIFRVPNCAEPVYQAADEYLSGNVRKKLIIATAAAQTDARFLPNVKALEKVQPKDLTASEISVRLGTTWLPTEVVQQFIYDLLNTPFYMRGDIVLRYSKINASWNIQGKSRDKSNVAATNTYGSSRINAYKILEETLNLKDVRIFDYTWDEHGNRKPELNKKETAIAQGKQEQLKAAFTEWIWRDPTRREKLTRIYNDAFNSVRPREYDGSHIVFGGINPEIMLRRHQINAIAHILYGGNALLAHVVGAGKTFEMIAAAMESKRLGLCNKSLFVVPNHLTEQWASEFLQLYPSANILVATRKEFEKKNRKKFCGRIATGDYDAIIIGHSQFEKIPMSVQRQRAFLGEQMDELLEGIIEAKGNEGDRFTVKQLEKTKKALQLKLDKLNDQSRKDDVVTFEELGVDRLFIDESHYYKNLFLYTKMRNVAGISQTEAQKSSDLFMKSRYLNDLTGGRGMIFATGTPISNSMVEMYTIQRYLQYDLLREQNLHHFDAWASVFGETVTAIELSPEGTGYRAKTRFSKFNNLPELMCMFKEVADIQTADMLQLPVPIAHYNNIKVKPSELQIEMVAELAKRAEAVRDRKVEPDIDNMLRITNDGRKLALDQRMENPLLPDDENSKVNTCVRNIFRTWENSAAKKSAQLVFCDLSTPKANGRFSVYTDMRDKLIAMGIPADEVRFIHEADTEAKKKDLFAKVRRGEIRVLFGSTAKMGAGTNVQQKLIASHDLDCPWRPSDLERASVAAI